MCFLCENSLGCNVMTHALFLVYYILLKCLTVLVHAHQVCVCVCTNTMCTGYLLIYNKLPENLAS